MSSQSPMTDPGPASGSRSYDTLSNTATRYLIRGGLFVFPLLITLALVVFAYGFLTDLLMPLTSAVLAVTGFPELAVTILLLISGIVMTMAIGAALESVPYAERAAGYLHARVEDVPGIGGVYGSFREMSETIADGEQSFEEVKLVEYPTDGSYTMAFVTADTPVEIEETAGHEATGMVSLFLPMGPNPVMGGFVIYVSRDRVHDINISVEEGLQAVITSGVALDMESSESTA